MQGNTMADFYYLREDGSVFYPVKVQRRGSETRIFLHEEGFKIDFPNGIFLYKRELNRRRANSEIFFHSGITAECMLDSYLEFVILLSARDNSKKLIKPFEKRFYDLFNVINSLPIKSVYEGLYVPYCLGS